MSRYEKLVMAGGGQGENVSWRHFLPPLKCKIRYHEFIENFHLEVKFRFIFTSSYPHSVIYQISIKNKDSSQIALEKIKSRYFYFISRFLNPDCWKNCQRRNLREKQAKNWNERGSNLSLGTRLTRVKTSKPQTFSWHNTGLLPGG